jgi:PmbA protein
MTIAERDDSMARDFWSSQERRTAKLEAAGQVGETAARRSIAKLGARGLSTRRSPVLLIATVATSLLQEFCNALTGTAQFQTMTFLPDAIGREATAPHLDLAEDPFEPFGLASAAYDSEGVAGCRRNIVEGGTISGLFLSSQSARKLGMRSTGNADGFSNLTLRSRLAKDDDDLMAMFRRMGTGLWLTEFLGGNVNPVTGAYSKAATGFWIENGEIAGPVENFTIAGNLADMLRGVVAVGIDVHREGPFRTGSILIDTMQIAGR